MASDDAGGGGLRPPCRWGRDGEVSGKLARLSKKGNTTGVPVPEPGPMISEFKLTPRVFPAKAGIQK
ncbi:hypothetical protein GCM10007420_04580 [Glycocaulis albus]|uniref:Uncharacterized protein n=1 Tax=Glycocaulis albus TaxID=1382801 RepID=A0ABQ1XEJ5_9PROT|nr:hypothetical protein GCM10007420_04580 [Glycocaulis albus]